MSCTLLRALRAHSILTLDFPPLQDGGIARWMDELARGLISIDRDVVVLTRGRKRAALAHDRAHPARVVRLPGHGWVSRHQRYLRWFAPFLGRFLRDRVVHAATFGMAYPLLSAFAREHAKLVLYTHGLELAEARTLGGELREQLEAVLASSSLIIANSNRVAELVRSFGVDRVSVVTPAIDPSRLSPSGTDLRRRWEVVDRPVILTLARLVERKGQDTILRALPLVRAAIPSVAYVIAGRGPDEDRLRSLAASLGVADSVRFAGFIDDAELGAAYRSCDVYAMIPRETEGDLEGFGITYLEAGACERAVIGGRSGGVPDAIRDGETGLLVDPLDVSAVAAVLIELLQSPERRLSLGTNGRRFVLEHASHREMALRIAGLAESNGR